MALIQCPNCKGKISDTVKKCIHCGFDLSTEIKPKIELQDFDRQTTERQNELRDEFYTKYPNYDKINEDACTIFTILLLSKIAVFVSAMVFFVARIFHSAFGIDPNIRLLGIGGILLIVLFITGIILHIVSSIKAKKYLKKELLILKKFGQWLIVEKNMEMKVYFEQSEKKSKIYFDSVNVDMEV